MMFENRVVLITGGGGGIGRAAARRFLEEGARVVLNNRRREVLDEAQVELDPDGDRVAIVPGDAGRPETAERLVASAVERFGRLDVLVNSTGIFRPTPFLEQTEEHGRRPTGSSGRMPRPCARARSSARLAGLVDVGSGAVARHASGCGGATGEVLLERSDHEAWPHRAPRGTPELEGRLRLIVEDVVVRRFMSPDEARAGCSPWCTASSTWRHGTGVTSSVDLCLGS